MIYALPPAYLFAFFIGILNIHIKCILSCFSKVSCDFVQMMLMSGLSRSALEELSSEKIPDDRIPHICNILRFAVLKKDHSFMAIGGPCVSADGSNPTGDEFSLTQTALRFVLSADS